MPKNKIILEDNLGNEVVPVTDSDSVFLMDYNTKLTDKLKSVEASLDSKANKNELTNSLIPKGTLTYASLPITGNTIGWYYYCPDGDGTHGAGNYIWNGSTWYFGGTGNEGYNLLKSELSLLTGMGSVQLTKSGYINTEGNTVDISAIVTSSTYCYDVISCNEGDIFTIINGKGGNTPRLWCFIDSSGKSIMCSEAQITASNTKIIAPFNSAKLIINSSISCKYFKGDIIANTLSNVLNSAWKEIPFKTGGYITTNGTTVDVSSVAYNADYKYAVISCKQNDVFLINGKGGNASRLWCFIDSSNNVIMSASENAQCDNYTMLAPKNSTCLIINDCVNKVSYKAYNTVSTATGLTVDILKGNTESLDTKYIDESYLISSNTFMYTTAPGINSRFIDITNLNSACLKITANANLNTEFAFLRKKGLTGEKVEFSIGNERIYVIGKNQTMSVTVPPDATYIYFVREVNGVSKLPSSILKNNGILGGLARLGTNSNSKTVRISASNSSEYDKLQSDFICSGTNDEEVINYAIRTLVYGGTIILHDGDYYINNFSKTANSAIFFEYTGYARTITFKGSTENKSYLSKYGVTLNLTDTVIEAMDSDTVYTVFNSYQQEIPIGNWQAFPNNVNFENFYLFVGDASKKIVGINGQCFGSMDIKQVGIYNKNYFHDRFNHVKPTPPAQGSIGVISVRQSNDEMARIGMDCLNVGGLHTGVQLKTVDHLIMQTCTMARCNIGYQFDGKLAKTLTMINCCDEGNTHLPRFTGEGHLTCIDFNIERLNFDFIPDDITGDTELYAYEETPSGWHGFISYTLQGEHSNMYKFWKDGSGHNFKTINLDNDIQGTDRPKYAEFGAKFFDISTNKTLTYNGSAWVDAMGNIIP